MAQFLSYLNPTLIFPALVIFLILWFFLTYWHAALGPRRSPHHTNPTPTHTTTHPTCPPPPFFFFSSRRRHTR